MREVVTIDCQYLRPRFAAAYLLLADGEAAFIDNNTEHSVPLLLTELRNRGLTPDQVKYVMITHVHLDHAGGTSALMAACPRATLLAHPRAVPHLLDPSKLESSARKVYGDATFEKLYGKLGAVPPSRARSLEDGERVSFGGHDLVFLHTRGHANHHFCILDEGTRAIFTGDSFGLAYPDLQKGGFFIFPSTSPTDFDPDEAKKSVTRIAQSGAERAFPTHFGEVRDLRGAEAQLLAHLDFSGDLLRQMESSGLSEEQMEAQCRRELGTRFEGELKARGFCKGPELQDLWDLLKLDLDLNAAGIAYVAAKRRAKAAGKKEA